jgi:hypothetical protein
MNGDPCIAIVGGRYGELHIVIIIGKYGGPYNHYNGQVYAGKEAGLEVNSKKTKYVLMSRKKAGHKQSIKIANRPLKVWQNSNIWEQH